MPPTIKTTAEDVVQAAITITRREGWDHVNARSIAKELHCSTQPVFRAFTNMEQLKKVVYEQVEQDFQTRLQENMRQSERSFLTVGLTYIQYAQKERNLYRLLFMSDYLEVKTLGAIGDDDSILPIIQQTTGLSRELSQKLLVYLGVVTHGIASMVATNACDFTEEEITALLLDSYRGYCHILHNKD
ncbi:TetR/AcrR family transcriptional regulator [Anaerosporobacter faecicola]|uniref:TetR/AcrR family transcriptional regulator n=1 Tax=Anaerosporobacter faecicola TaxID=2718714 RepID=UPI00143A91EF|nr:TetR/AcrR family transcriptional regulator [Anaerosporobacter faecicola]